MDRDRALYPVILIVIATYYVLFSLVGGSEHGLVAESVVAVAFIVCAFVGFRISLWIVVVALALHGVYDLAHPHIVSESGVPAWWAPFCLGVDVVLAIFLGGLLISNRLRSRAA